MTHPDMPLLMPDDSAWRQWRGAARDYEAAKTKLKATRQVWLQNLLGQFEVRRIAALESGVELSDPANVWALGVPCGHCLRIIGAAPNGHSLVQGGAKTVWSYWAECGAKPINVLEDPMPTVPTSAAPAAPTEA